MRFRWKDWEERYEQLTKKARFSLNPVHHHCGPFNTMDPIRPDGIDGNCWDHDNDYKTIQDKFSMHTPYTYTSNADDNYIINAHSQPGIAGKLYAGVFRLKRKLSPRLAPALDPISPYTEEKEMVRVLFKGKREKPGLHVANNMAMAKYDPFQDDFFDTYRTGYNQIGSDYHPGSEVVPAGFKFGVRESFGKKNKTQNVFFERLVRLRFKVTPFSRTNKY